MGSARMTRKWWAGCCKCCNTWFLVPFPLFLCSPEPFSCHPTGFQRIALAVNGFFEHLGIDSNWKVANGYGAVKQIVDRYELVRCQSHPCFSTSLWLTERYRCGFEDFGGSCRTYFHGESVWKRKSQWKRGLSLSMIYYALWWCVCFRPHHHHHWVCVGGEGFLAFPHGHSLHGCLTMGMRDWFWVGRLHAGKYAVVCCVGLAPCCCCCNATGTALIGCVVVLVRCLERSFCTEWRDRAMRNCGSEIEDDV